MPREATELKERLESYRQTLGTLGMRDYQVNHVVLLLARVTESAAFEAKLCRVCSSTFVLGRGPSYILQPEEALEMIVGQRRNMLVTAMW